MSTIREWFFEQSHLAKVPAPLYRERMGKVVQLHAPDNGQTLGACMLLLSELPQSMLIEELNRLQRLARRPKRRVIVTGERPLRLLGKREGPPEGPSSP